MFKIGCFPSKLESFFCSLKTEFHWEHFEYFRTLVLLTAFAWGRRNISALYRFLDPRQHCHRSRFNNFMRVGRWDPAKALRDKACELLALLKPRKGEHLLLIIDDSKKQKQGKHMDAVGWIHDSVSGRSIRGHQYVKAVIKFRGYTIPFGIRLYVKKDDCPTLGLEFKKTTQFAAELIGQFQPPPGVKVRVLFDSYYLCRTVVKACRSSGFHFTSTLKSNRNLFRNGRKLKAGQYGKNLFRRSKKTRCVIHKQNTTVHYSYVDADWMDVSDLGALHVIFSRKGRERNILGIVTDDPDLSAKTMIQTYGHRWSIELFFKDSKQLLGLGQYQNGSYRAAVIHLHLVCFAYALLTHIAIEREGEKGTRKSKPAARLSTAELQNELRRIVWQDMVDYLKELPSGDSVVKELQRLLLAA